MLGLLAILLAWSPPASPATRTAPADDDGQIVVRGHALSAADVRHIVLSISKPESTGGFERQYPRWKNSICVSVIGFPREGGQFIADEIGRVARGLKLKVGAPGCVPTIEIVASSEPSDLIAKMRRKRPDLFVGREPAYIQHVQTSSDPVRWLRSTGYVSSDTLQPVGEIGSTAMQAAATQFAGASGATSATEPAGGGNGWQGPTLTTPNNGSLIQVATETYLSRVIAIVDTRKITKVSYQQIADYLALGSLTQSKPSDALQGADSILTLFPLSGDAPNGLTRFDQAYLTALYAMNPSTTGAMQRGQIISSVSRSLRASDGNPSDGKDEDSAAN